MIGQKLIINQIIAVGRIQNRKGIKSIVHSKVHKEINTLRNKGMKTRNTTFWGRRMDLRGAGRWTSGVRP